MLKIRKSPVKEKQYTVSEERWNTATHVIGAIMSLVGLLLLLVKAFETRSLWDDLSFTIYGLSLILLYTASSLYHAVKSEKAKKKLRVLDHAAIFVLIAGTYTPVTLLAIDDPSGGYVFVAIWTLALIGILFKLVFTGKFNFVSTIIYLAMGWLAIIILDPLIQSLPMGALILLFGGGLVYSGGTLFYLWDKLPYNHAIWHVMVVLGSVCHFLAIYFFI